MLLGIRRPYLSSSHNFLFDGNSENYDHDGDDELVTVDSIFDLISGHQSMTIDAAVFPNDACIRKTL